MDIFAVGCVIAELFVETTPLFNLAQLLSYRAGDHSTEAYLVQCVAHAHPLKKDD
jgi:phosphoinositide-3-kinase, regulatory subunit 4